MNPKTCGWMWPCPAISECPLLAQSGHCKVADECPLLGGKADITQICRSCILMTQSGHSPAVPCLRRRECRAVISPTPERFEYVLALLASIRTAYFWTLSGYCWHARSTTRNEVLCGRFTRRLKLKSMNNPNPTIRTSSSKAASRTKVVSKVASKATEARSRWPAARRAEQARSARWSAALISKIQRPGKRRAFSYAGSLVQRSGGFRFLIDRRFRRSRVRVASVFFSSARV